MKINTRRWYFNKFPTIMAAVTGAPILFAQQPPAGGTPSAGLTADRPRRNNHIQNGIYYFSGTGSNDGYPKDDHVLVTDPFEKHVTRTMDALDRNRWRRAGCRRWTASSTLRFSSVCRTPMASRCLPAKRGSMRIRRNTTH